MSHLPIWINDNMRSLIIQLTAKLITVQQQESIFIYESSVHLQDNLDNWKVISLSELVTRHPEDFEIFMNPPPVNLNVVAEVELLQTVEETNHGEVIEFDSAGNFMFQEDFIFPSSEEENEDVVTSLPIEEEWPVKLQNQITKILDRQMNNNETIKQYYKIGQLLEDMPAQYRRQLSSIRKKINKELGIKSNDRHYVIEKKIFRIFSSEEEIEYRNNELRLTPTEIFRMRNREVKELEQ